MFELDQGGRGKGWTRVSVPPRELADYVERFWLTRVPAGITGEWRIVADASAHLLIHAGTDGRIRVRVVGARGRFADTRVANRKWTVAVRFRMGAIARLTGLPATDLLDVGTGAEDVWGAAGRSLVDRVQGTPPERVLEPVCAFLRERCDAARPLDRRVSGLAAALADAVGPGRIAAVAREVGAASRTLRAVTRDHVGLPPIAILRIKRLQHALGQRLDRRAPTWSVAALAAGYADQAHMNRDCRSLLGESPGRFVARAGN